MDLQNYFVYILGGAVIVPSLVTLVYVLVDEQKKKKKFDAEMEEWRRNEPMRRAAAKAKAEAEAKAAEEEAARVAAEAAENEG